MRERVTESFRPFADRLPRYKTGVRLLGTSGTVTTLASRHLELPRYDLRVIDGLLVPSPTIRVITMPTSAMPLYEWWELHAGAPCVSARCGTAGDYLLVDIKL